MAIVKGDRIGESQRLNKCSREAADFYAAMLAAEVPDDFGRFRDTAHHVWIRMYPRQEPTPAGLRRVRRLMAELAGAGLWRVWSVDGVGFAELHNAAPRGNLYHRTPEPPAIPGDPQPRHVHTKRCATTAIARAKEWGDVEELKRIALLLNKKGQAGPEQRGEQEGGQTPSGPRASVLSVRSVPSITDNVTDKQTIGATPNPLVNREALIKEGYALVTEIAKAADLDPTEVMRTGSKYKGRGFMRFENIIGDDRLAHSVADLRDWARRLRGEADPDPRAARPRPVAVADPVAVETTDRLLADLERRIDKHQFTMWFRAWEPTGQSGDVLRVRVPSGAIAEWLAKNHMPDISAAAAAIGMPSLRVEFEAA